MPKRAVEPITVSESPLIVTAVPEGGTLVPNLENQVFRGHSLSRWDPGHRHRQGACGWKCGSERHHRRRRRGRSPAARRRRAGKKSGSRPTIKRATARRASVRLQARDGADQILLRTEHAVYRAGDRIALQVFSTKSRGTAYVDVVKEGQTVLTRDVDIVNGQAGTGADRDAGPGGHGRYSRVPVRAGCPSGRRSPAGFRAAGRRVEDRGHGRCPGLQAGR
jgi:hypothetical protein